MTISVLRFDRANFYDKAQSSQGEELDLVGFKFQGFLDYIRGRPVRLHEVVQDEVGNLPLISAKEYETVHLWWVIGFVNGIIHPFEEIVVGRELTIPSRTDIENYILAETSRDRTLQTVRLPVPTV